jgi:HTH-type transcriptional regulator/antitoxin HigA
MSIKPIKSEVDYEQTLARIGQLADTEPQGEMADELEVLITLAQAWDEEQSTLPYEDPIEAIVACMKRQGLNNQDLTEYIGHSGRVSEILNYKRSLTLPMIRKLTQGLGIPAETLIQSYKLKL